MGVTGLATLLASLSLDADSNYDEDKNDDNDNDNVDSGQENSAIGSATPSVGGAEISPKNKPKKEMLRNVTTLVIDANGYAMFIAEKFYNEGNVRSDIGMSYEGYDAYVQAHIDQLLAYNLILEFIFDGPNCKCKAYTRMQRGKDRDDERNAIIGASQGGKPYDAFMPPILTIDQFKCTLLENVRDSEGAVQMRIATHEADQEIAITCVRHNIGCAKGSELAYVYANDSDFVVMKDCPYIKFGALFLPEDPYEAISEDYSLQAKKVWRRKDTSKSLQLSEESFVEFCILVGNDFTRVAKRSAFDTIGFPVPVPGEELSPLVAAADEEENREEQGEEEGSDSDNTLVDEEEGEGEGTDDGDVRRWSSKKGSSLGKALNYYSKKNCILLLEMCVAAHQKAAAAGVSFQVTSSRNEILQMHIEYSRAFYNLGDVSSFPDDSHAYKDVAEEGELSDDEDEDEVDEEALQDLTAALLDPDYQAPDGNSKKSKKEKKRGARRLKKKERLSKMVSAAVSSSLHRIASDAEDELPSLLRLSRAEWAHLTMWMSHQDEEAGRSGYVGNDVCRYLVHAVRSCKLYQGGASQSAIYIKNKHLEALKLMREQYTEERDELGQILRDEYGEPVYKSNGYGFYDIGVKTSNLNWEDVIAGWFIERLYSTFMGLKSTVPQYSRKEHFQYEYPHDYTCSPAYYYNGVLFHSICQQLEAEALQKGAIKKQGQDIEIFDDATENAKPRNVGVDPRAPQVSDGKERLPIDAHKERILEVINRDRVTIIHGETGCGKSSRLPCFILDNAEAKNIKCKMFVCQPRRIAASALFRRVKLTMGNKVGLRMGNGVKDGNDNAQIIYATTGYLTRLLAYHPEAFDDNTHLVIDEVHERSVDSDLLCMLARQLLSTNPTIKLILMSATIHTGLYKKYFEDFGLQHGQFYGDMECLSVGVRRFPIQMHFLDDIEESKDVAIHSRKLAKGISVRMAKISTVHEADIDNELIKMQYNLAVALVQAKAVKGTGVLIFVSGIVDITEILERFEGSDTYFCIGIHSDIPEEEQARAFDPTPYDKIKVVVATNAAESSLTIPDCDLVVCLGTHKSLHYQATSHRVHLLNSWISQASSTQRAGACVQLKIICTRQLKRFLVDLRVVRRTSDTLQGDLLE